MAEEQHAMAASSSDQLSRARVGHAGQTYQAVQELYWKRQNHKRSAPTPVGSGLTTPAEPAADVTMGGDDHNAPTGSADASLIQSFSLQDDVAWRLRCQRWVSIPRTTTPCRSG